MKNKHMAKPSRKAIALENHKKINPTLVKKFKLKPKHAKPVRFLHVAFLLVLLVMVVGLSAAMMWYFRDQYDKQLAATSAGRDDLLIQSMVRRKLKVKSTLGFSITVDPKQINITASEVLPTGRLQTYSNENISQTRAYAALQLYAKDKDASTAANFDRSSMTILASDDTVDLGVLKKKYGETLTPLQLVSHLYMDESTPEVEVNKIGESIVTIGGQDFLKTVFLNISKVKSTPLLKLTPVQSVTYVTIRNNKPFAIKLSAISDGISPTQLYEAAIDSITFEDGVASGSVIKLTSSIDAANQMTQDRKKIAPLASKLFGDDKVFAQNTVTTSSANTRLIAKNSPAVVKIYHLVCGTFVVDGKSIGNNDCGGSTGSGFIVSKEGIVATNGHVAKSSARDILAEDPELFALVLKARGASDKEVTAIFANESSFAIFLQAIYQLPEDAIHFANQTDIYAISLSDEIPDLAAILKNRKVIDTDKVKSADLIGSDYASADLYSSQGFTKSDVALLKMGSGDYPVVQLGSLDGLNQGSNLTVIGFPGNAENNGLTDDTKLVPTATNGVVSAVRDTNGGGKKVVQSDVKISHGNSGGPAFDDTGKVFGLATYSLGAAQTGDASISYMRDVKDLKDLASSNNVTFDTTSEVQAMWDDGLTDFFNAHYKKAITKFDKVSSMYPAHRLTAEYIATAKQKITDGMEAKNPMMAAYIAVAIGGSLIGLGVTIFLAIRHHGKHQIYKVGQQMAGAQQVAAAGMPGLGVAMRIGSGEHAQVLPQGYVPGSQNNVPNQQQPYAQQVSPQLYAQQQQPVQPPVPPKPPTLLQ